MLEERGIATVVIGAVRAQMERTRPPCGLWTTFQLGRPLGEPQDPGFQRRVLMAALGLLERRDGPVILEDFTDDPPGWRDHPGWQAPALASGGSPTDGFARELAALMPAWRRSQARFGRTTVGLSRLAPAAWAAFAHSALAGQVPATHGHGSAALSLRFLCDDVKAFYGEAAQADGPPPSGRQVDTWFWRQTAAGRLLQALRRAAMASEENSVATVGGRFLVPAPWVET
jgi:hypothetical protein